MYGFRNHSHSINFSGGSSSTMNHDSSVGSASHPTMTTTTSETTISGREQSPSLSLSDNSMNQNTQSSAVCLTCRRRHAHGMYQDTSSPTFSASLVDPYHLLQVRRDATPQEIRQAYQRLGLLHHPGRTTSSSASSGTVPQQQQQQDLFRYLAASYETLMDTEARERYNVYLKQQDQQQQRLLQKSTPTRQISPASLLWTGQVHVGGKRFGYFGCHNHSTQSSSWSSRNVADASRDVDSLLLFQEQGSDEDKPRGDDKEKAPRLLLSDSSSTCSSTSSDDEDERHYTERDTNRLFGGPLQALYKARQYRAFDDPYTVFDGAVGSSIFRKPTTSPVVTRVESLRGHDSPWKSAMPETPSTAASITPALAAWTVSTTTVGNTEITTTTRTLKDRVYTRTETRTVDRTTGQKHTHVAVTSQDLDGTVVVAEASDKECVWSCPACDQVGSPSLESHGPYKYEPSGSMESPHGNKSILDQLREALCACGPLFPE